MERDSDAFVTLALLLGALVGAVYALMFLKWGRKVRVLIQGRSIPLSVEEWLRRLS